MNGENISSRLAAAMLFVAVGGAAEAQQAPAGAGADMTYFVTSVGSGRGADLGGLEGADAHCARLAQAAGPAGKTWRAYLSTQGAGAVNARDRIGRGPWRNARGEVIARDIADLHGPSNNLNKGTALTERGETVKGRGDQPNTHDILIGSQADGIAFSTSEDRTCGNYSKGGVEGAVMVGHHDRMGLSDDPLAKSWYTSHLSRSGCSPDALRGTGGAGLFYCFAANLWRFA